ncbi:MAG: PPC domain-containing protein [Thainema sp.]
MMKLVSKFATKFAPLTVLPLATLALGFNAATVKAQSTMYVPIPIQSNQPVDDVLSNSDIPTGFGGYSRDYTLDLTEGDQVAIDLTSDEFDTLVSLIAPDGSTLGENDDGPDGTTNSLLFARITQGGKYTVRVRSYAGDGIGPFTLKVTRLRPVE